MRGPGDDGAGEELKGLVRVMKSLEDVNSAIADYLYVAELASVKFEEGQIRGEFHPAPHTRPSSLPAGFQAVYVFLLGDVCLKVGKAGPKTRARFTSQHYLPNSAPSTLAKSILNNGKRLASLVPQEELDSLNEADISAWILRNTARVNILMPLDLGLPPLTLLESFLQCRLRPMFEGRVP